MNKFAQLLAEAVDRNNLTYKRASEWSGVSADLISRIILGNRLPSPGNAMKIAKALGINEQEALNALSYDKVPSGAKKYFEPPEAKYPLLRQAVLERCNRKDKIIKKIIAEIQNSAWGGMESLIVSRILTGAQSFYEDSAERGQRTEEYTASARYIEKQLKNITLEIKDEKKIVNLLEPLLSWEASVPDYSLQMIFRKQQGQRLEISSGGTRYETSVITFTNSEPVEVPLMEDKIAAGSPLPISGQWNETRFFTSSFISKYTNPILIEVGKEQDSMIPRIFPGDLLLIDRKPVTKPRKDGIYAVNLEEGGSIKYCYINKGYLHITCENKFCDFKPVKLELNEKIISEIIVGEVVWIGRELGI